MSLRAPLVYCLPEDTAEVAHAAFPQGNAYMRVLDTLGPIYQNAQFAALFPKEGQPALAPAQLALVTLFQFAEGLSDRQAADAVRARIDWKYALCLPLKDAGFDASVLCEFRARLVEHGVEAQLFETLLTALREQGFVKARGQQRTDSTHVLAAIQVLNRLEMVGETLRHALNTLATVAPAWLQGWVPDEWFARYSRRFEEYRLPPGLPARTALAAQIGADGRQLLTAICAAEAPRWLREVPAVETLRQVWVQQFSMGEADAPIRWRAAGDLPPSSLLISSPYDPDARYASKRSTRWVGYKVHLTETCDDDTPHIVTDVTTTVATTADNTLTATIQERLAARGVPPREQLVDTAYVTADHLLSSQADHQCTLLGPIHGNYSWQARADQGFATAQFRIDWEREHATCPQGKTSAIWKPTTDGGGHAIINIRFAHADCRDCPMRAQCVSSARPRALAIRPQAAYAALQEARARQHTALFKEQYAKRAGVEGTIAQGVGLGDLRRSRYRGLVKTRLLHFLIAAALNLLRLAAWLAERPLAQTRTAAFARLAPVAG